MEMQIKVDVSNYVSSGRAELLKMCSGISYGTDDLCFSKAKLVLFGFSTMDLCFSVMTAKDAVSGIIWAAT